MIKVTVMSAQMRQVPNDDEDDTHTYRLRSEARVGTSYLYGAPYPQNNIIMRM